MVKTLLKNKTHQDVNDDTSEFYLLKENAHHLADCRPASTSECFIIKGEKELCVLRHSTSVSNNLIKASRSKFYQREKFRIKVSECKCCYAVHVKSANRRTANPGDGHNKEYETNRHITLNFKECLCSHKAVFCTSW